MERGVYSENQTQPELSLGMVLNLLRIKNIGFCLYNKHTPIKVCIVYIKKCCHFIQSSYENLGDLLMIPKLKLYI